jgi:hypothetical protein
MINHDQFKERIKELIKVRRKYASFFDWFKREKNIKEIGITNILLENIEKCEQIPFHNLQISPKDPPDVIAENLEGKVVGVEVCELVDEEVIRRSERGEEVFRYWNEEELIDKIQKIIERKDNKEFLGGPYEKIFLLIHTDEHLLDYPTFRDCLSKHEFKQPLKIDTVYLLFSYSPHLGCHPYIKLRISVP